METDSLLGLPMGETSLLQQLQQGLRRYSALQQTPEQQVAPPGPPPPSSLEDASSTLILATAAAAGDETGAAQPSCSRGGSSRTSSSRLTQWREELVRLSRLLPRVNRLTFSPQALMWVVRIQTRSARVCRSFSVRKLGFFEAREHALQFLKHFDEAQTNPAAAAAPTHAAADLPADELSPTLDARGTGRPADSSSSHEASSSAAASAGAAAGETAEGNDPLSNLGDNSGMAAAVAACAYLSRQRHQQQRQKAREAMAVQARLLPHKVGVKFDPTCPRWIAHWKRDGQRFFKSFSVEKNGFETAWKLAVNCRRANCEDYHAADPPQETPAAVKGTPAAAKGTPAAVKGTPAAVRGAPAAVKGTPGPPPTPSAGEEETDKPTQALQLPPMATATAAAAARALQLTQSAAAKTPQKAHAAAAAADAASRMPTDLAASETAAGAAAAAGHQARGCSGDSSVGPRERRGSDCSYAIKAEADTATITATTATAAAAATAGWFEGDPRDGFLPRASPSSQQQLLLDGLSVQLGALPAGPAKRGLSVRSCASLEVDCPQTPKRSKGQEAGHDLTDGLLLQSASPTAATDDSFSASRRAAAAVAAAARGNPAAAQLLLEAEASLLRRISGALRTSSSNSNSNSSSSSAGCVRGAAVSTEHPTMLAAKALQEVLQQQLLLLARGAPDSPKETRGASERLPPAFGFGTPTMTLLPIGSPVPAEPSGEGGDKRALSAEAAAEKTPQQPAAPPAPDVAGLDAEQGEEKQEEGFLLALLKQAEERREGSGGPGRAPTLVESPRWSSVVFATPHPEETVRGRAPRASLECASSVLTFSSTSSTESSEQQGAPNESFVGDGDDSTEASLLMPLETGGSRSSRLQFVKAAVCLLLRDLRDVCLLSWVPYYVIEPKEEFACLSRCLRFAEDCEDEQQLQPFLSVFSSLIATKTLPSTLPLPQQKDVMQLMLGVAKLVAV